MTKRTIAKIPISPGTPVRVEDFRYVDQGLEWNMQNEFDLRDDHLQASRVINWEVFNEDDLGLDGWTPGDSLEAEAEDLILSDGKAELYIDEGIAYIGGRGFLRDARNYIDDGTADPGSGATNYNIYLKYTESSNEFAFLITTSTQNNDHLIKYLLIATADWDATNGWSGVVDKRASNTALGAPATVSGSDPGPILTVENTDSGLGLLVRLSDAQIGEDGTPQILTIWGTNATGLTLKESGTANTIVLSCDAAGRMKVTGDINITGTITSATWQGGVIANAYIADDITLTNLTQITTKSHTVLSDIGSKAHSVIDTHIDTTNIHYTQPNITTVGIIGTGTWQGTQINSTYLVDVSQPLHSGSSPTFVGLTLSGTIATPTTITTSGKITSGTDIQVGSNNIKGSGGVTAITLSSINVSVAGDITAVGNDYKTSGNMNLKGSNAHVLIGSTGGTMYVHFDSAAGYPVADKAAGNAMDLGRSGTERWDECYADNWNNESCLHARWHTFDDALSVLRSMKGFETGNGDPYRLDPNTVHCSLRPRIKVQGKEEGWTGGYEIKQDKEKTFSGKKKRVKDAHTSYDKLTTRDAFLEGTEKDDKSPGSNHSVNKDWLDRYTQINKDLDETPPTRDIPVGNYSDGYIDEDFERSGGISINRLLVVAIQAIQQLEQKVIELEAQIS